MSILRGILFGLLLGIPACAWSAEFATSFEARALRVRHGGTTTGLAMGWQGFLFTGAVEFVNPARGPSGIRFYGGVGFLELGVGTEGPSLRARMLIPLGQDSDWLGRNNLYLSVGFEQFLDDDDAGGLYGGLYFQVPY